MYISDCLSVSPQDTFRNNNYLSDLKVYFGNKLKAIEPDYTGIINPNQLRRMGKALRMGIACGTPLMQKHKPIDGIIIGTSDGGLDDCMKFLNQIVDYDEGTLTPTNFVQSTPNAVAGHLAIANKNTNYNNTHVNKGLAFENALIDAKMLFCEQQAKKILIGNIEEISDYNYNIDFSAGQYKTAETSSDLLLTSNSKGTVCGEGSTMFILESEKVGPPVKIKDIETISYSDMNDVYQLTYKLLKRNGFLPEDIDGLILGFNGNSETDYIYSDFIRGLFENQTILTFKNLVGEYPTATAFALKMAYELVSETIIPTREIVLKQSNRKLNNLIIYNHYKNIQHSLILIGKD